RNDLALEVGRRGRRVEAGRPALDRDPGRLAPGPAGEAGVGRIGPEDVADVHNVVGAEGVARDQVLERLTQRGAVVGEVHLVGVVLTEIDAGGRHVDARGLDAVEQ